MTEDYLSELHRLAMDYRTATQYSETAVAWSHLQTYVAALAREAIAAEQAVELLNDAWKAVPRRFQEPAKDSHPQHPLPAAIRNMARALKGQGGGTG